MTIDQEKMLDELIMGLQSTDYDDLLFLSQAAYNRALDDAIKSIESEPDFDVVYIKRLKIHE